MNVEDDEAGRLAGFRARFGRGYDSDKETTAASESETTSSDKATSRPPSSKGIELDEDSFGEEEDSNLLELISSYGQAEDARVRKKEGGRRKGKGKGKGTGGEP
jgi:hypothetical protein